MTRERPTTTGRSFLCDTKTDSQESVFVSTLTRLGEWESNVTEECLGLGLGLRGRDNCHRE